MKIRKSPKTFWFPVVPSLGVSHNAPMGALLPEKHHMTCHMMVAKGSMKVTAKTRLLGRACLFHPGLSKRLRVAGEMGKVTGEILQYVSAAMPHVFREAGVDSKMRRLPAYLDNHVIWCKVITNKPLLLQEPSLE